MKFLKLAMPGLGLLFLGYLIGKLGPAEILRNFALMKWSFPLILLLACSWHISNSLAWSFAFPPGAFRPRFRTLIMAKLAGDAVNQLTPLANIGGEPLKAYLLKHESPTSRGLASVVINKTAQVMTGLLFATVGLGLVVIHNLQAPYAIPLPLRVGLAALLLSGAGLIWLFFMKQKHMFSSLLNLLRRIGVNTQLLESRMAKAANIDDNIKHFYRDHKGRFFLVLLFHALGWLLGACETFVILKTLVASTGFQIAFLITALTVVINSLFFFMPSNIGVLEGGQVFLFLTLGLSPAMGLSLGIVKRMRKILWISIGWLLLTRMSRGVLEANVLERSRGAAAFEDVEQSNSLNYP
jgi:uncharacterized protein (TIRG00374 family)